MKIKTEEFRRKYPHLAEEIFKHGKDIRVRVNVPIPDPWRGYIPNVEDYIRRCRTLEDAYEVIDYLRKNGEITDDEATYYKAILEERGLEYFGPTKEDDYYYKKAQDFWEKLRRKITYERRRQLS